MSFSELAAAFGRAGLIDQGVTAMQLARECGAGGAEAAESESAAAADAKLQQLQQQTEQQAGAAQEQL
jgi:hypothetical protein